MRASGTDERCSHYTWNYNRSRPMNRACSRRYRNLPLLGRPTLPNRALLFITFPKTHPNRDFVFHIFAYEQELSFQCSDFLFPSSFWKIKSTNTQIDSAVKYFLLNDFQISRFVDSGEYRKVASRRDFISVSKLSTVLEEKLDDLFFFFSFFSFGTIQSGGYALCITWD